MRVQLEGTLVQSFQTEYADDYSDTRPIPEHMATDRTGRIYLSFGHNATHIQVFSRTGEYLFKFGRFASACGICITARDNVIIADREDRTLSLYTTNGQLVQELITTSGTKSAPLHIYPHDVTVQWRLFGCDIGD